MTRMRHLLETVRRRISRPIARVLSASEGIAALEFGLLAPIAIYILLIGFDLANALFITRRLTNTADVVAQLVSQQVDHTGVEGTITDALLNSDFFAAVSTFPDVLADAASKSDEPWQNDIQVIASQVQFGPAATCTYAPPADPGNPVAAVPVQPTCNTANVVWSVGFTAASPRFSSTRTCGANTLKETKKTSLISSPDLGTMPWYLYLPGDIIVVDIAYTYTPMFTKWITGSFTFQRTAYIAPRFFTQLTYTPTGTAQPGGTATLKTYIDGSYSPSLSSCAYTGP